MEITDDNHCFVCGELNLSGLRMRPLIDVSSQSASMQLVIPCAFQGWQGVVTDGEVYAEATAKMFNVTGEQ